MRQLTAREIADDLAQRITDGQYGPAAQLHFETLADLYGVKRSRIKRAMSFLRDRGLVEDVPGEGVYVVDRSSG